VQNQRIALFLIHTQTTTRIDKASLAPFSEHTAHIYSQTHAHLFISRFRFTPPMMCWWKKELAFASTLDSVLVMHTNCCKHTLTHAHTHTHTRTYTHTTNTHTTHTHTHTHKAHKAHKALVHTTPICAIRILTASHLR
jgi:hypothetical protein